MKNGLSGGGPSKVITSMGIFSFDPASGEMVLSSHHPGVTVEQVKKETGWPLKIAESAGETAPPSEREIAALRKYDPRRIWTA